MLYSSVGRVLFNTGIWDSIHIVVHSSNFTFSFCTAWPDIYKIYTLRLLQSVKEDYLRCVLPKVVIASSV